MAFWYFGYGSNMDRQSMRAKGVVPRVSRRATLPDWQLRFNVGHFFRHEGGVANIEPAPGRVLGVVHHCDNAALAALDAAEAYGHGYDRIAVHVETEHGPIDALTYVGMASFIDDRCLPTQRYLNILIRGAEAAGIEAAYIAALRAHPVHAPAPVAPFKLPDGIFPAFTAAELASMPTHTALGDAVFDMSRAREKHFFLRGLFGGRDMTLWHLQRMDSSDGTETLDDIQSCRLTVAQQRYLDAYLHEYAREYAFAGRLVRDAVS